MIRTPRIGPVGYAMLLRRFGSAAAALDALPGLAFRSGGAPPSIPPLAAIEAEVERVAKLGARHLLHGDPDYPALLGHVEAPPPALIVRGDTRLFERPTVAMVGARNASSAGVRFARALAHDLSERGWLVVSGLARGIDTAAHVGSIAGGTAAVIAGGIDIVFPPENAKLQAEIAERGVLIAEQVPGIEPRARDFPRRNRIIAGLAAGTVVVEAAPKSGSLITARLAGEYGREVMAVPGSPLDPRAQGCNLLIREGATLVQSAADVIEALSPIASVESPRSNGYDPAPPAEVDDRTREAVAALLGPVPVPVDEVIRQSGLGAPVVQMALLELELAGRLERHAGGRVSLIG